MQAVLQAVSDGLYGQQVHAQMHGVFGNFLLPLPFDPSISRSRLMFVIHESRLIAAIATDVEIKDLKWLGKIDPDRSLVCRSS